MTETRALLLTDVVDSTQLSEALGDARMAAVWEAHDRVARDLLPGHRGLEIDKTDGFLMLFESASDAVDYALAYHAALATLEPPLLARAGLHVGPVILRHNPPADVARGAKPLEVDGLAKPMAARVMSLAHGAQTLLTAEALDAVGATELRVESHGHWRVKGVSDPMELFEIGPPTAPFAPPSGSAKVYRVVQDGDRWIPVHAVPHSLPAERDDFVGRQPDLRDLAERLDGGARLVTVLGPGGAGKTRLVVRYGWVWLGDYPGGVWFCDAQQATDLEEVWAAVARALNLPLGRDPSAVLGHAIAGRGDCLVVIDNFEQVADHAEAVLGPWLERAPRARFVVTSREVLGVAGETQLVLDTLPSDAALELFLSRARAVRPEFDLRGAERAAASQLVELLDRLPLAIELAAARVKVLPPTQLLARMSERFQLLTGGGGRSRQSTLRATLRWSWSLLDPWEKSALAQVSVFAGPFDMAAADAVIDLDAHEDAPWSVDVLQALVDKSLLRVADGRFSMMMSVREYTEQQLVKLGEARSARRRHVRWAARLPPADRDARVDEIALATGRAVTLGMAEEAVCCLRGAWSVLERSGPVGRAVALAGRVLRAFDPPTPDTLELAIDATRLTGDVDGAEVLALQLMSQAVARGDTVLQGRARWRLGSIALDRGDWKTATELLEAAVPALAAGPDRLAEGGARASLGIAWGQRGEHSKAREQYEIAGRIGREAGDGVLVVRVEGNLALIHFHEGDSAGARAHMERGLEAARACADRVRGTLLSANLGAFLLDQGDVEAAEPMLREALEEHRAMGNRRGAGTVLGGLAWLHHQRREWDRAEGFYAEAGAVARELGNRPQLAMNLANHGMLLVDRGALDRALPVLEEAHELNREVGGWMYDGHVQRSMARLALAQGDPARARAFLDEALAVYRTLDNGRYEGVTLGELGALHLAQGRLDVARMALDMGEGLLRDADRAHELATLLRVRLELLEREGQQEEARQLREEIRALEG